MHVFAHHIYEFRKGLRCLILHTLHEKHREEAESRLVRLGISYYITKTPGKSVNLFFGAEECVNVVRNFGDKQLNELSPEEDFILGTMLGYGLKDQCERYIRFKNRKPAERNRSIRIA
jgi:hypothetical protein